MIDFKRGVIIIDQIVISVAADDEALNDAATDGLMDQRTSGRGNLYYYFESIADEKRFGVFIRLRGKNIDWIRLSWLDSPTKDWSDVSEKAVKDEFRMLITLVEKQIGRLPDEKENRLHTWSFDWGKLEVSYDLRSFQADIYMRPRYAR